MLRETSLLLLIIRYALGAFMLPLSLFDKDSNEFPRLDFGKTPYIYVASDDSDVLLKKIKFILTNPDNGEEQSKNAFGVSTMTKPYSSVMSQKKVWSVNGTVLSVTSKLTKEEAATLRGVLYTTNTPPDDTTPVFDAWRGPLDGTTFDFGVGTTAVFLENAPAARARLSNFSMDLDVEISVFSGIPGGSASRLITTYKNVANQTMDPINLSLRAFTVQTTGKAHFVLGGNNSGGNGSEEVKTSPSTGVLLSSEYPVKTGASAQQNVTYDKKMKFSVNATFDLNEDEFVVVSFTNVNSGVEVDVHNVTASGPLNVSAISEQLRILPSSKRAGAFLISYSTEDTDQQQEPTGASPKPGDATTPNSLASTTTKGSNSQSLSLLLFTAVTTILSSH